MGAEREDATRLRRLLAFARYICSSGQPFLQQALLPRQLSRGSFDARRAPAPRYPNSTFSRTASLFRLFDAAARADGVDPVGAGPTSAQMHSDGVGPARK